MARNDAKLDSILDDWTSVTAENDPLAFKAWANWRREALHCYAIPKAFTVPSEFPPTTQQAVNYYLDVLVQIRQSIGWKDKRARFPDVVRPYHG